MSAHQSTDEKTEAVDYFQDRYGFLLNNPMKKECYCIDPDFYGMQYHSDNYIFLAHAIDGSISYMFGTTDNLNDGSFDGVFNFTQGEGIPGLEASLLDWNFEDDWEKADLDRYPSVFKYSI